VFAIAADRQIGMADYLAVEDATLWVDEAGRQEACKGAGSLPNGRTVHAFVSGKLRWASMHSQLAKTDDWQSAVFNPHTMKTFQLVDIDQPIHHAKLVVFTPDPMRVWYVPSAENKRPELTA